MDIRQTLENMRDHYHETGISQHSVIYGIAVQIGPNTDGIIMLGCIFDSSMTLDKATAIIKEMYAERTM